MEFEGFSLAVVCFCKLRNCAAVHWTEAFDRGSRPGPTGGAAHQTPSGGEPQPGCHPAV